MKLSRSLVEIELRLSLVGVEMKSSQSLVEIELRLSLVGVEIS